MKTNLRVFDGVDLFVEVSRIDFGITEVVGTTESGIYAVSDIVNIDYPVRIKDINNNPIYENDIVRYRGEILKVVFDYRGVYGVRRRTNRKKRRIFLGAGCEIIGNIYKKEYAEFKEL